MISKKGKIAFFEIFLLVVAIFSFGYLIGEEFQEVSGQSSNTLTPVTANTNAESYYYFDYEGTPISTTGANFDEAKANAIILAKAKEGSSFSESGLTTISRNEYFSSSEIIAETTGGITKYADGIGSLTKGTTHTLANNGELIFKTASENIATKAGDQVTLFEDGTSVLKSGDKVTKFQGYPEVSSADGSLSLKETAVATEGAEKGGGFFGAISRIYGLDPTKVGYYGFFDVIQASAAWGVTTYFAVKLIGGALGFDEKKVNAAATAAGIGVGAGQLTYGAISKGWLGLDGVAESLGVSATGAGFIVGAGVTVGLFLLLYKDDSYEIVTFECLPFQAPLGGADCEKCNEQGILPCSEYQCRSLGGECEIVNEGTSEQSCVRVSRHETGFPIINPWEEVLTVGHSYRPDNAVSPPERGFKIINTESSDGCIAAFTPLRFGIELDKPGKCKLDYLRKRNFDDMDFFFGGSSLFRYNHTQVLSLPGPSAINNASPILQNDGEYQLYVRCMDANGLYNTASVLFSFCVDKGPDTTPPLIVTTNILNNMPIAYNTSSINVELYTNEPANCKWSRNDQAFNEMEGTMLCSQNVLEMNAQLLYKCQTTLDSLKNRQNNDFYFRCEDKPSQPASERIQNTASYKFTLIGTEPLFIDAVSPNGTVKDSSNSVKVTLQARTSAGYNEGEAECQYSPTGNTGTYISFFNTNSYQHSQDLYLKEGDYRYFIKCFDLAGNTDEREVSFEVETDTRAPSIVRAYNEDSKLKIITSEKAVCVYGIDSCSYNFDEAKSMTTLEDTEHYIDWNTDFSYFIKCEDEYGNRPDPNQCSIVVKPFKNFDINTETE